jgi:hypothetical protein
MRNPAGSPRTWALLLLGFSMEKNTGRPLAHVTGPDGTALYLADLPAASTRRWVARRKAAVVAAVRGGLLSLDDACRRYALSREEFSAWERALDRFGPDGLKNTRARHTRHD